jgi:putative endonuclease
LTGSVEHEQATASAANAIQMLFTRFSRDPVPSAPTQIVRWGDDRAAVGVSDQYDRPGQGEQEAQPNQDPNAGPWRPLADQLDDRHFIPNTHNIHSRRNQHVVEDPSVIQADDMTKARQALGEWGERLAAAYLTEQGMVILDRNWRTSAGEIDIVARDVNSVIFCEVKTRRGTTFGEGGEAVTDAKTRRLRQLALQWLATSGIHARSVRFDVVSVLVGGSGAPVISHIRDAF